MGRLVRSLIRPVQVVSLEGPRQRGEAEEGLDNSHPINRKLPTTVPYALQPTCAVETFWGGFQWEWNRTSRCSYCLFSGIVFNPLRALRSAGMTSMEKH